MIRTIDSRTRIMAAIGLAASLCVPGCAFETLPEDTAEAGNDLTIGPNIPTPPGDFYFGPTIGVERQLHAPSSIDDGDVVLQHRPALGFDGGSNYLVAWDDNRDGAVSVYVARMSAKAAPYGGMGTYVGRGYNPSLAFDGTNFLVAWTGATGIVGARVSRTGTLLDATPLVISAGTGRSEPAVTYDGARFVVAWTDQRNASVAAGDIYAARVERWGTVVDPNGILVATGAGWQSHPTAASDGNGGTMIAWQDDAADYSHRLIHARRLNLNGQFSTAAFALAPAGGAPQFEPHIVFDGENYLAVWIDTRRSTREDTIYSTVITPSGAIPDAYGSGIFSWSTFADVHLEAGAFRCRSPRVTFETDSFLVAAVCNTQTTDLSSGGSNSIISERVTVNGDPLPATRTVLEYPSSWESDQIALGAAGGAAALVWIGGGDVIARPLVSGWNQPEAPSASNQISYSAGADGASAAAFDGTNHLVVWSETRGTSASNIYGLRVGLDGAPVGSTTTPFAVSGGGADQLEPSVAFDGTNWLVVWARWAGVASWDIYAARVSRDGVPIDAPTPLCTAGGSQRRPRVLFDGVQYLVVWTDYRNGSADVYGTRVSKLLGVLDPQGVALAAGSAVQTSPSAAFDGANYLIAWTDTRSGNPDIYAARFTQTLASIDGSGFPVAAATTVQSTASVACGSSNCLLVWLEAAAGNRVLGRRFSSASSSFLDGASGIAVGATSTGGAVEPTVTWNASRAQYWVAWSQSISAAQEHDLYAARVTETGTALDGDGQLVAWNPTDTRALRYPALSATPTDAMLVSYTRSVPTSSSAGATASYRAFVRAVTMR